MIGLVEAGTHEVGQPVFDAPNILWYFGASAGTLACLELVSGVGDGARGLWMLLVALGFAGAYVLLAAWLLRRGSTIPGGVVAAWTVAFVLAAGDSFEQLVGLTHASQVSVSLDRLNVPAAGPFARFEGHELGLGILTVAAGLAVYVWTRFPFVLAFAVSGALISAELLVPAVVSHPSASDHATALIVFGIALLVAGILVDLRAARRQAFWFHVVGLMALSAGLAYHAATHSSWGWKLILVEGILVLALAAPLRRATWTLFGIAGLYAPLAHYASDWFGSTGTDAALGLIGFAFVALGIAVQASERGWVGLSGERPPRAPSPVAGWPEASAPEAPPPEAAPPEAPPLDAPPPDAAAPDAAAPDAAPPDAAPPEAAPLEAPPPDAAAPDAAAPDAAAPDAAPPEAAPPEAPPPDAPPPDAPPADAAPDAPAPDSW
jgi:hypothetical protein